MEKYLYAKDLPDDWENNIKNNNYLEKNFLEFIEKVDNTEKSYYVFRNKQGAIDTQFLISKTRNNNITMFTPFEIPVVLNSVYFPFTLSKPAGIFGLETREEVSKFLSELNGFKIVVNVDENCILNNFSGGMILPKCILKIKWDTFKDYMSSLRASYRRRYNVAFNKSKKLNFYMLKDNSKEFDENMYNLYLDVYNNAPYKLGKVSIDFFRQKDFIILVLEDEKNIQGFAQLHKSSDELLFEFVGLRRKDVRKYDTYIRLLIEIVRYGIENNFKIIDFGQTTDDAKLKLGCKHEMLYALINHSNSILNFLLKIITPYLEYKQANLAKFRVFKVDK